MQTHARKTARGRARFPVPSRRRRGESIGRAAVGLALALLLPPAPLSAQGLDLAELAAGDGIEIAQGLFHLGNDAVEDWGDRVSVEPDGTALDLPFIGTASDVDRTLTLYHLDVHENWTLTLDDTVLGRLPIDQAGRTSVFMVPAGAVRDGRNTLRLTPDRVSDDIIVGEVRLLERSYRETFKLAEVIVRVTDSQSGAPVAARLTITDGEGALPPVYLGESATTAVRPGIVYVQDGVGTFALAEGRYTVVASKGMEWGLDAQPLQLVYGGGPVELALSVAREVDTTGWIAADTHIHTLTHSGHGDSSVEERMITLAAEGVELAIATDHNHNVDYRAVQREMGLMDAFTSVTGNEVSTPIGHFNAFPLDADDEIPEHEVRDWVDLVDGIKAKGARVVILNHPRWPDVPTGPFGKLAMDRTSGERPGGERFLFDGMEVVNALCEDPDPLYLTQDWIALLNRGERIVGVGSSDSHTVIKPVGLGRSYLPSRTDDPGQLDVDALCDRFLEGRVAISNGIFVNVEVDDVQRPDDPAGMGDVVPVGEEFELRVRVASASWVRPREVHVFLSGRKVATVGMNPNEGRPTDRVIPFRLVSPIHDSHLIVVVVGDGVEGLHWETFNPWTLGITNPVWLDRDGDGRYTSPRDIARAALPGGELMAGWLLETDTADAWCDRAVAWSADVLPALDDAAAVQYVDLLTESLRPTRGNWAPTVKARFGEVNDAVGRWVRSGGGR